MGVGEGGVQSRGMGLGGSRVEHVRVGWEQEKSGGSERDGEGAGGSRRGVGVTG